MFCLEPLTCGFLIPERNPDAPPCLSPYALQRAVELCGARRFTGAARLERARYSSWPLDPGAVRGVRPTRLVTERSRRGACDRDDCCHRLGTLRLTGLSRKIAAISG